MKAITIKNPWAYLIAIVNNLTEEQYESQNSCIIGEVEIVDCVQNSASIWAEKGQYHWVLANAKMYDEPILNVKGKQSFWEYEI